MLHVNIEDINKCKIIIRLMKLLSIKESSSIRKKQNLSKALLYN